MDNNETNGNDFLSLPEEGLLIADAENNLELGLSTDSVITPLNEEEMSLDVDQDGTITALTDGILIVRFLFGLTGEPLITGAVGAGAIRSSADAITNYLNQVRDTIFDVDGNGQQQALTDGIMVVRFLFGLRGEPLTRDAVASDATRIMASDIETHLQSFNDPTPISSTSVSIAVTDSTATEPLLGIDTGTFTISRSGGDITQAISVNYRVEGTAENGIDYENLDGVVIIPAGETEAEIPLSPVDDALVEGEETVIVTLTDGENYSVEPTADIAEITIEDVDIEIPEEVVTFDAPSITQISETTWEMELEGSDGSKFISTIANTGTQLYQQLIRYIPTSSNEQGYRATINPEGTRMEVQFDGKSEILIVERNGDESVGLNLLDNGGITNIVNIPIDPELLEDDSDPIDIDDPSIRALCETADQFCKSVKILGDVAGGLGTLTALTGVGIVPGGFLGAVSLASRVIGLGCLVLLGDDSKLVETVLDEVTGAFGELGGDLLTSASRNIRQRLVNRITNLGGNGSDEIIDFIIEETGTNIGEKTFDFISSSLNLQERLESDISNQGGFMREFRRELGIDFCDKNEDTEPPIEPPMAFFYVTCNGGKECTFGVGETGNFQVSFINPDNNSSRLRIIGSSSFPILGLSLDIPPEAKGGGVLNFTLENVPPFGSNCRSAEVFLQAGLDTDEGGLFGFESIDINLIGNSDNSIFPCSHTIEFVGFA